MERAAGVASRQRRPWALEAGADGLAVVSAIVADDDPEAATRRFAALFA